MKICFYALRPFDELGYCEEFSKKYGIDYVWTADPPRPDYLALAMGCDAVSTNPCEVTPAYLEAFAKGGVRYLPCRSIGYDHLPLEAAKRLGMRVSHSHYPPEGVANYTIMLMLMASRKMNQIMLRAAAQDYSLPGKMGRDLSGCTVGVIGAGKIGRTVLRHLAGFGCRRLAYDLYPAEEPGVEFVPLDTLLAESDVISLHLNATPVNHHLIDAAAIAKMKRGALLINTARGTLIDPEALVAGLESGQIGGAGLDVVEEETDICYYNRCGEPINQPGARAAAQLPECDRQPAHGVLHRRQRRQHGRKPRSKPPRTLPRARRSRMRWRCKVYIKKLAQTVWASFSFVIYAVYFISSQTNCA